MMRRRRIVLATLMLRIALAWLHTVSRVTASTLDAYRMVWRHG